MLQYVYLRYTITMCFSKRGCVAPTRGAPDVRQNPPPPPVERLGVCARILPLLRQRWSKNGPKNKKCARTPIVYTTQVRKKKGRKAEYQMCIVMQKTS